MTIPRSSRSQMFFKMVFLKILQYSQESTCVKVKLQVRRHVVFSQQFSCEYYEILRTAFFNTTPPVVHLLVDQVSRQNDV